MNEDKAALEQLKRAVQALAASAEDQARLFPPLACPACELISDFTGWHHATVWREALAISVEQRKALQLLQSRIDAMEQTPCFSMEAIRDREDWQRVRASAARCLECFGWEQGLPPEPRSSQARGG